MKAFTKLRKYFSKRNELLNEVALANKCIEKLNVKLKGLEHLDNTAKNFGLPYSQREQWDDEDTASLKQFLNSDLGRKVLLECFHVCDAAQKNAIIQSDAGLNRYAFGSIFMFHHILRLAGVYISEIHWVKRGEAHDLVPKFSPIKSSVDDTTEEDNGALFGRMKGIWNQ